ncbi:Tfp pilus tip-associated adhesin PilY1 [Zhongshania antarctica]|uniref:Tfp pilus tip-associated adhesin PilY1 n=1 Tax=Zhongshania antarctica TaxID=641702 RepID=A0A840R482_9GAMM|nr:PilC/PilY family type IV pilus protein [Zhongshania antarctica]MBB5188029.1 Tfp pilus tip-associated adhesin PilY1 [Zhongshania antarctica]
MNKFKSALQFGLFLLLTGFNILVFAEDIDLFTGSNPADTSTSTVIIGWHTSANISASVAHGCVYADVPEGSSESSTPKMGDTVGGMEQCALVNAIYKLSQLPAYANGLAIGLMVFEDKCGKLLLAPKKMTETNATDFIAKVKALDKFNGGSVVGDMVAEAWAVFNGLSGQGNSCSGSDYSSYAEVNPDCSNAVFVYLGNAVKETASVADFNFSSASTILENQVTNAFQYAAGSNKYNAYMTPRAVTLLDKADAAKNSYWGDEWTRFMHSVDVNDSAQIDRNVTTYSIAVYDEALQSKTKVAAAMNFISDMGTVGGGKSFKVKANESDALTDILTGIFSEVQDVNSVFSSATLPVSQNSQGTYKNQVFVAMFRPDAKAGPRWYGNVKQYQFGIDAGGSIVLTDASQSPANATDIVNPITGGLLDSARSFWTTNTPLQVDGSAVADWPAEGFWVNSPEGNNPTQDSPDGDLVQKGAVAQALRIANLTGSSNRTVYTCNSKDDCPINSALANFNDGNATLLSNLGSMLSGGTNSDSATFSVGSRKTAQSLTIDCDDSGKVADRVCRVTYAGYSDLTAGDTLFIDISSGNAESNCTASASCKISSVTSTGFTLPRDSFNIGKDKQDVVATLVFPSDTFVVTTDAAHGYTTAVTTDLIDCELSVSDGSEYGLINVVNSKVGIQIQSIIGPDSFLAKAEGEAYASAVTCASSVSNLDATSLVNWARGDDIAGNEAKTGACPAASRGDACPISVRGSIHGDVLHSRPTVVNYAGTYNVGDDETIDKDNVVVFYGSNDGHYRAVNGNQTRAIGNVRPGGELWSFIAPEFFGKLERQYTNIPAVSYPGFFVDYDKDGVNDAEPRDYFFDGATTLLQDLRSDETLTTFGKTYIYITARRGGALVYALDVSDPVAPKILWKVSDSEISELGQTWSQAKVTQIAAYPNPVLIMGAGYDPAEDADPAPSVNTKGRGILILDALNGKVVWAATADSNADLDDNSCLAGISNLATGGACVDASMSKSFPADITLVDANFDGLTDRLYAVDVAGNIWRVDLEPHGTDSSTAADIKLSKFASLGVGADGNSNDARKFLYGPDIIPTADYAAIVAVTGDREHPLYTEDTTAGLAYNVQNRFYMILDRYNNVTELPDSFTVIENDDLLNQTFLQCYNTAGELADCSDDHNKSVRFDATMADFDGYFFNLGVGEKGVNQPVTASGVAYFATNKPDVPAGADANSCTANLGIAQGYQVALLTGDYVRKSFPGGGMPPTVITGVVEIDGKRRPFVLGGEGSPFKPVNGAVISGDRDRTYWYYK